MGGGKSTQKSSQSTYDNDVVAGEGALALGEDASLITNEGDVEGGGVGVTGEGNEVHYNSGVQVGAGASYFQTQMDQNTRDVLAGSLALVGNNANNMMVLAAGSSAKEIEHDISPAVKGKTAAELVKEIPQTQAAGILVFLLILSALILKAAEKRGSKK